MKTSKQISQLYLDGDFWQVVWVPQTGGDVELEVLGVLNDIVPQPDVLDTLLLEGQLLQHRLQDGVQLFSHVL